MELFSLSTAISTLNAQQLFLINIRKGNHPPIVLAVLLHFATESFCGSVWTPDLLNMHIQGFPEDMLIY